MNIILEDPKNDIARTDASTILYVIDDFEFSFLLHLMQLILGITFELSQTLQKKDQDLANAIALVKVAKSRLQSARDDGFDDLFTEAREFCKKYDIDIPKMKDNYCLKGRPKRRVASITFFHYFKVNLFNTVIDAQLQ